MREGKREKYGERERERKMVREIKKRWREIRVRVSWGGGDQERGTYITR